MNLLRLHRSGRLAVLATVLMSVVAPGIVEAPFAGAAAGFGTAATVGTAFAETAFTAGDGLFFATLGPAP